MINLKEAMNIAKNFIIDINGEQEALQLEEIILSSDEERWEVTYSYSKKLETPNQLQAALGLDRTKSYKRIVIDNKTGNVVGMYNWAYENREAA